MSDKEKEAEIMYVDHQGRSLLKKFLGVKLC